MKITGTKSSLKVEIGQKTLLIKGELTTTPAFYADINSIIKWEPPFENELIDDIERKKIISEILAANQSNKMKIIFE